MPPECNTTTLNGTTTTFGKEISYNTTLTPKLLTLILGLYPTAHQEVTYGAASAVTGHPVISSVRPTMVHSIEAYPMMGNIKKRIETKSPTQDQALLPATPTSILVFFNETILIPGFLSLKTTKSISWVNATAAAPSIHYTTWMSHTGNYSWHNATTMAPLPSSRVNATSVASPAGQNTTSIGFSAESISEGSGTSTSFPLYTNTDKLPTATLLITAPGTDTETPLESATWLIYSPVSSDSAMSSATAAPESTSATGPSLTSTSILTTTLTTHELSTITIYNTSILMHPETTTIQSTVFASMPEPAQDTSLGQGPVATSLSTSDGPRLFNGMTHWQMVPTVFLTGMILGFCGAADDPRLVFALMVSLFFALI